MSDSKRTFEDVQLSGSSLFTGNTKTGKPIALSDLPRTNRADAGRQASVEPSPRATQEPARETTPSISKRPRRRSIRGATKPWDVTTGCTKCSPGCLNCHAPLTHARRHGMYKKHPELKSNQKYFDTFDNVHFHESALGAPYIWRQSLLIFVNPTSDLFHMNMKLCDIQKTFKVMNECSRHTFILSTRRAHRMAAFSSKLDWTPNIWAGVSVECNDYVERVELLKKTGAHIKWVNLEPLIGDVPSLNLEGIDWAVVGGESGNGKNPNVRPMKEEWVLKIQEQCAITGTQFLFTDWGGSIHTRDKLFRGKEYSSIPPYNNTLYF